MRALRCPVMEKEGRMPPVDRMGPVSTQERSVILDALRGLALFGICLANFPEFSLYTFQSPEVVSAMPTAGIDRVVRFLQYVFIDGKFYSLFSLLFGIGFSIMMSHSMEKGRDGIAVFYRRMGLLALIGPASDYLTQVALPMALLGIGQGLCLGPLTQAGVARVGSSEAGAAAGAVNTAHQLGGTLGLALQVAVFAGSGPHLSRAELPAVLAHRIAACMAVGSGLLFSALLVVWLFILMPQPVTPVSSNP